LAAVVARIRREAEARGQGVLLLDAGDFFHGTPESDASGGRNIIKLMNLLGYDALCPGNHDFARGAENLARLSGAADFPFVSCNIVGSGTVQTLPYLKRWVVREVEGVRVGITGLITPQTRWFNHPASVRGIDFLSPRRVLAETVARLRGLSDIVVLLSHLGLNADKALGFKVAGIDVIVGGHSHNVVSPAVVRGKTLVCQAGSHGRYLGRVDLTFDRDRKQLVRAQGRVLRLDETAGSDPELRRVIEELRDPGLDEIVAQSEDDFPRSRLGGSAAGRLVTDAMREGTGADVCVINSASIGEKLHKGPLSRRALYSVVPYNESMSLYRMTGSALRRLLETAVHNGHPVIQVSGLEFCYNLSLPKKARVMRVLLGGRPMGKGAVYTVATTWYFAERGGAFASFFGEGRAVGTTPFACLEAYVRKRGKLTGPSPDRMLAVSVPPLREGDRIDVNSAPATELVRLHGIGPDLARRIVAYREEHGGFEIPEDLLAVKGVGPKILDRIRPFLLFGKHREDDSK
jgi:competence ComEA-like helix-hairpin-helix protein